MDITFRTNSLEKNLNNSKKLVKEYGKENARKIQMRMSILRAANCLNDIPVHPPERRHELSGKEKGNFAVDIKHPFRIIFSPAHEPVPVKEDGGIDLTRITAIRIEKLEDYH
jgi:proteic killer suppression protein